MKKTLSILSVALFIMAFTVVPKNSTTVTEDTAAIKWQANFDDAVKLAKKKKEPLLVLFTGSDWCMPCKMLHADLFDNPDFIEYADKNLILYKADFPRKPETPITPEQKVKNNELRLKYKISGFPTIILLNSQGEVITTQKGYSRTQTTQLHWKAVQEAVEKYN